MSTDVVVPALGNEISEGLVVEWLRQAGEEVAAGDPLVVIETPKLNLEVEAPVSGKLARILRHADEIVEVGATLATIEEG